MPRMMNGQRLSVRRSTSSLAFAILGRVNINTVFGEDGTSDLFGRP